VYEILDLILKRPRVEGSY